MTYSNKDIDQKLREYPSLVRVKRQLEFELALPADTDGRHSELIALLEPVSIELRRMEYYLELLPEDVRMVLKALYFKGLTYRETAAKLIADVKTITNRKNRGLSELAAMYGRLPK